VGMNPACRVDCRYRRTLVPTTDGQLGRLRLARARRLADSITDDGQLGITKFRAPRFLILLKGVMKHACRRMRSLSTTTCGRRPARNNRKYASPSRLFVPEAVQCMVQGLVCAFLLLRLFGYGRSGWHWQAPAAQPGAIIDLAVGATQRNRSSI
jgi:hypothetical protein